jgi:hypothetical protein
VPIAEETQADPAAGPPPPPPPRPSPAAPPPRCPARHDRHLFAAAVAAATTHTKVIHCFMETGQFDNHGLLPNGLLHTADWGFLLEGARAHPPSLAPRRP